MAECAGASLFIRRLNNVRSGERQAAYFSDLGPECPALRHFDMPLAGVVGRPVGRERTMWIAA
jgi:hypothetical protein